MPPKSALNLMRLYDLYWQVFQKALVFRSPFISVRRKAGKFQVVEWRNGKACFRRVSEEDARSFVRKLELMIRRPAESQAKHCSHIGFFYLNETPHLIQCPDLFAELAVFAAFARNLLISITPTNHESNHFRHRNKKPLRRRRLERPDGARYIRRMHARLAYRRIPELP